MEPAPGLPSLSEFGLTRDELLAELKQDDIPPLLVIGAALIHLDQIEQDILDVIERARKEDLDDASANLFFCGVHILGGRRYPSGYRPFVDCLIEAGNRTDRLLGDAVTNGLPRILCGLFDGETAPLVKLIEAEGADQFARASAIRAFAFLTFDGRIDKTFAEDFLRRFERETAAQADPATDLDAAWEAWAEAVALLGIEELFPRVQAACADERIPSWVTGEEHYRALLADALARPSDISRLEEEGLGYIEDVADMLEQWRKPEAEDVFDSDDRTFGQFPSEPAHNPHRNVGRNDPCPCGSGKKFKKCCLRDD